jgi:hypothetical protein
LISSFIVHSIFSGGSSGCLLELVATVSINWSRGSVAKWPTFVAARRQVPGSTVLGANAWAETGPLCRRHLFPCSLTSFLHPPHRNSANVPLSSTSAISDGTKHHRDLR